MSIDPNSRYILLCNGEAITPEFTNCILDYWTAETVADFIEALNLDIEISIKQVSFINSDPKAVEQRRKWRVLK